MVVRSPKGYIEPKYKNLGKSKVVRIPIEFVPMFERVLSISNSWENDSKGCIQTLERMIDAFEQVSKN